MYACPKCGKKESSWDGTQYCSRCEAAYQQEMADWEKQEQALLRQHVRHHGDDCDCELCQLVGGVLPNF